MYRISENVQKRTHHPLVDIHKLGTSEDDKCFNLRCRPQRKVERQVKVLIKNLAIFFTSKQFLQISFQMQLQEYFPPKQKEQRHKQLGYTDKLVTTQI